MNTQPLPNPAFPPEARPMFPGSPYSPVHSPARRAGYAAIGMLLATLVNLGNGIVLANIPVFAGARSDYLVAVSLLPGVYIACNASANLMLVKGRAQLGIPKVTSLLLLAYASCALLLAIAPDSRLFAILLCASGGLAAAGLTTLSVYYVMQSLPQAIKPLGLVTAIGFVQLGTPLGHLVPIDLVADGGWRTLALTEFAIALIAGGAIALHPLPPSDRSKAFEPLDGLTLGLFLVANLCLCVALATGRLLWWSDTPWVGIAIVAALALYAAGSAIEANRRNPLLRLEWIGSWTILRYAAIALVVRLALSEQTYGAFGFLGLAGLDNDQFHILYALIVVGLLLGTVAAAASLAEERLPYQVMVAALVIAVAAWIDSGSNNLTRPENLYLTQSLIAFGTTLFIGPALVYGSLQMLRRGPQYLVSHVILFSMTQNIGGLAGSALFGTYQIARTKAHAAALAEGMMVGDPRIVERIQDGAATLSGHIGDPALRSAEGAGMLGQALAREAAILGFNDAFTMVALVTLSAALFVAVVILRIKFNIRLPFHNGAPR